ncbi:DUF4282 domain-containing protein [Salinisphaera sp. Q1T1-3]|uniref:DUF4282 domain-containing protein n=1 Tax=Salinisphaera sp. Q1T1-3 TaxID=2321229 RepID=UPI0013149BA5|nr:DUF4282 domain-containing protein [Salinisphaera sp. Q1T1-3]
MTDSSRDDTAGRPRGQLFRALFDTRFSTFITAEMVPAIYRFGIVVSALTALSSIALAFRFSWLAGVLWAVVLGPVLFIAMVVTMRVALEFVLSVFRMGDEMRAMEARLGEVVRELDRADQLLGRLDYNLDALQRRIGEIHEEIPRLAFWRRSGERK